MTSEQRELVRQAVAGDRDALGVLLEQLGPAVAAALIIGPQWRGLLEVADVMQVTYLEAFMQIGRFDPQRADAFGGWLRRMAENNLRDAVRALEARKSPPPRMQLDAHGGDASLALFDILTSGLDSPSRVVRGREAGSKLKDALACLPADYARVVELYDMEGKLVAEVAEALGRSEGAVYMLRMRAHEQLRELLGNPSDILDSQT